MKYPRLDHDQKQHIKVTKADIEVIRTLFHSGKVKSLARLASTFNTTAQTIQYWIDPLYRENQIKIRIENLKKQALTDPTLKDKKKIWKVNQIEYLKKVNPLYIEYVNALHNAIYHRKSKQRNTHRMGQFRTFMACLVEQQ